MKAERRTQGFPENRSVAKQENTPVDIREQKIISIAKHMPKHRVKRHPIRMFFYCLFFAAVVTGLAFFFIYRDNLSEDLFADLFSRLRFAIDAGEDGQTDVFSYDDYMLSQFASFQNGLVLLSNDRLVIYGPSGREKYGVDCIFTQPALAVSDRTVLAYDRGGHSFFLADNHSTILKREWDNILYTAGMNRKGAFALVSGERGYASVCTVFDSRQREKFVWRSRDHYITDVALSPSADLLALVSCGQDGDRFDGRVTLFNTGYAEPVAAHDLPDTLPINVGFLDDTCFYAVTEKNALIYNDNGEVILDWPFEDLSLLTCSVGEDFLALGLSNGREVADTLVLLTKEGLSARKTLSGHLLCLSAAGGWIGVLTDGTACIYDTGLDLAGQPAVTTGPNAGAGHPSFEAILVTPWIRENVYSTTYHKTAVPANDGGWHVYAYEWHTTMTDGKVKGQKVDFYVDGLLLKTETNTIPFISANYWIGPWFPAFGSEYIDGGTSVFDAGWAGTPNFEMDFMMVDYFHFTPFDDEPWIRSTPAKYSSSVGSSAGAGSYPQAPAASVTTPAFAANVGNRVSNPGFENTTPAKPIPIAASGVSNAGIADAWGLAGSAAIVNNNARSGSRAMSVPSGGSANQLITGVYSGDTIAFIYYS